ncbi:MAG: hypothetical protein OEY79_04325, partial [Anaplasmataceae bacterium]|nr:hypothetical protein [Anaplasmataceae bacterium]
LQESITLEEIKKIPRITILEAALGLSPENLLHLNSSIKSIRGDNILNEDFNALCMNKYIAIYMESNHNTKHPSEYHKTVFVEYLQHMSSNTPIGRGAVVNQVLPGNTAPIHYK